MRAECRIMWREGLNRWPSRQERREVYSHDLTALARLAGLEAFLLSEVESDVTVLGMSWIIAKDWNNDIRYASGVFSSIRAQDMVKAIDEGGLLDWLLAPLN